VLRWMSLPSCLCGKLSTVATARQMTAPLVRLANRSAAKCIVPVQTESVWSRCGTTAWQTCAALWEWPGGLGQRHRKLTSDTGTQLIPAFGRPGAGLQRRSIGR
jgi:hypothetical protein